MDNYLTPKTATMQVILTFAAIYFLVSLSKVLFGFPMVFVFDGFFKNVSIYTSEII